MRQPIHGILFDLDETLHSRQRAFWAWVDSEVRESRALTESEVARVTELDNRGRGDKGPLLALLDDVFGWKLQPDDRLTRFRAGMIAQVSLEAGVKEMLHTLGARYRIGLLSNGTGVMQRRKLVKLGLADTFDPVIISGEVGLRKPDRAVFDLAISGWGIPPQAVLFIGDDPTADVAGARGAGMQALQLGVDLDSLLSLPDWLERRIGG